MDCSLDNTSSIFMVESSGIDLDGGNSIIAGLENESVFDLGGILICRRGEVERSVATGRIINGDWEQTASTRGLGLDLERMNETR